MHILPLPHSHTVIPAKRLSLLFALFLTRSPDAACEELFHFAGKYQIMDNKCYELRHYNEPINRNRWDYVDLGELALVRTREEIWSVVTRLHADVKHGDASQKAFDFFLAKAIQLSDKAEATSSMEIKKRIDAARIEAISKYPVKK